MLREPMFAAKLHALPTGPHLTMERKFDGWRVIASTIDGVRLETRTGNEITQVPYIGRALSDRLPAGTITDGEIVALHHDRQWNRTQEILSTTRSGYTHKPTAEDPALTYVVFDVLQIEGEDIRQLTLMERKSRLVELLPDLGPDDVLMHSPMQPPSDEALDQILAEGYEGVVVKDIYSVYVCGGRRHGWHKIKPEEEIEALCTGTYPAEPGSKYAPLDEEGEPQPWAVGGICFRVSHPDGREYEGRAAGMTDQLRRELHEQPERFIGLVVELRHWGVQESGALRHPNYRRFRSPLEKALPSTPAGSRRRSRESATPAPSRASGARRMRNYRQMAKPKLLASIDSLQKQEGEAYEKCLSIGSGDPAADLAVAREVAREKQFT